MTSCVSKAGPLHLGPSPFGCFYVSDRLAVLVGASGVSPRLSFKVVSVGSGDDMHVPSFVVEAPQGVSGCLRGFGWESWRTGSREEAKRGICLRVPPPNLSDALGVAREQCDRRTISKSRRAPILLRSLERACARACCGFFEDMEHPTQHRSRYRRQKHRLLLHSRNYGNRGWSSLQCLPK